MPAVERPSRLTRYAWLSIGAALLTMVIKGVAYSVSGSVGLLSDALESGVNLASALMALAVLGIVARPPDEEHAYGHGKAEYFSSGVEGTLIVIAAATIAVAAVRRLLNPQPLNNIGLGLAIAVVASLVNLAAARILLGAGRRYRSIALEADAQHLMSDVWSSAAILAGMGVVAVSGWRILDPLVALLVAGHIAWIGTNLVRRSTLGLMDTALPQAQLEAIIAVLDSHALQGMRYHALRSRQAGARYFVSMHIQVPGKWTIQRGHNLLEKIEAEIRQAVPNITVFTHIEPIEDPTSWEDEQLDRAQAKEDSPGG
jgi:cation diffusion facilitator family transporter